MTNTLVIIVSNIYDSKYLSNMKHYFKNTDFALITSKEIQCCTDSFFKYKHVEPNMQFSKVCSFLSTLSVTYEWYIKIRPEIELQEEIDFNKLSQYAINARLREYRGKKCILNGSSMGGIWESGNDRDLKYDPFNEYIILDDQIYIFHRNVLGAFKYPEQESSRQDEWFHSNIWKSRGIELNPIGIKLIFHHPSGDAPSNHVNKSFM